MRMVVGYSIPRIPNGWAQAQRDEENRKRIERGSEIHGYIVMRYQGKKDYPVCSEMDNFEKWVIKTGFRACKWEMYVHSKDGNSKGKFDVIGTIGSIPVLIDWKTGSNPDLENAAKQLNLYAKLINEDKESLGFESSFPTHKLRKLIVYDFNRREGLRMAEVIGDSYKRVDFDTVTQKIIPYQETESERDARERIRNINRPMTGIEKLQLIGMILVLIAIALILG